MRYVRIFLLHFQDVLHSRARSLVWFLVACISPLLLLVFWQGAIGEHGEVYGQWNKSSITSYYLLVAIATSLLIVHIESDVGFRDIKEGGLVKYLLRPFPYLLIKFMEEIPWRFAQGFFGVLIFFILRVGLNIQLPLATEPHNIALAVLVVVFGVIVSYLLKMVVGLTAFWTTDFWGMISVIDFSFAVFGGIIAPLTMYPLALSTVSQLLPFAYIIYFPVVAIEGILSVQELFRVIGIQIAWCVILYVCYIWLWRRGVKNFVSIGQ